MLGPGSDARWLEARGRIARAWIALVRGNHHIALPIWLIVVVPAMAAVIAHAYDPRNWLHWANVVFLVAAPPALAIAWLGDRTRRLLG